MAERAPLVITPANRLRKHVGGDFLVDQAGSIGEQRVITIPDPTDIQIDFALCSRVSMSPSASVPHTVTVMTGPTRSGLMTLMIDNGSVDTLDITWPVGVSWGSAGPPVIPAGSRTQIIFAWDASASKFDGIHDSPASASAAVPFILGLFDGNAATQFGSTTKAVLGGRYFDPSDPKWGLSPTSTAVLRMLIESTSGSVTANGELFQKSGTGAPQIIAATPTTTSTTAAEVSVDVSAAFNSAAAAGIFVARFWTGTPNGVNQAICTGAYIEVTP